MRVRLRFTKLGRVRFLSHRDVARAWERAIRRARLPIAYSEGFSPRPKVHFGLASSVGHESVAEYLDVDFTEVVDVEALPAVLSAYLPTGIDVTAAIEVDRSNASLQAAVAAVTWRFIVAEADSTVTAAADALMAQPELPISIERKGSMQQADLRPAIMRLEVGEHSADGTVLMCELATQPRSFRPAELLATFDPRLTELGVRRIEQWIIDDGDRRPPVPVPSESPPEPLLQAG